MSPTATSSFLHPVPIPDTSKEVRSVIYLDTLRLVHPSRFLFRTSEHLYVHLPSVCGRMYQVYKAFDCERTDGRTGGGNDDNFVSL